MWNPFSLFKRKGKPAEVITFDRSNVPHVVRPATARCSRCKRTVHGFRRYANGTIKCAECGDRAWA